MAQYKAYVVGRYGYLKTIRIDCADDDAAKKAAEKFIGDHNVELRQGKRHVVTFEKVR